MLCIKCKIAFETAYVAGSANETFYYKDFPKYGLEQHKCPECINEK